MKSAMLAAEAVFELLPVEYDEANPGPALEATAYPEKLKNSWLWQELHKVRNIRPGFRKGLWLGLINAALESYVFRGKMPWTMGHHADHEQLGNKNDYPVLSTTRSPMVSSASIVLRRYTCQVPIMTTTSPRICACAMTMCRSA